MSSRVSGIMGLFAWTMALLLLMGNLGYFSKLILSSTPDTEVWSGPLMPGKRYPLPDIATARVIGEPVGKDAAKATVAARPAMEKPKPEVKVLEPVPVPPVKDEKKEPPVTPPPAETARPEKKVVARVDEEHGRYVVQVGSFVLEMGMESLLTRMRENGLEPRVGVKEESVRLNNVQAGPYSRLEDAKVMETVLKSNGYDVAVEETWEGFILSLSRSLLLGFAVHDMEKAQTLGVKPLRMVKIEADMPVKKVFFGPYVSKDEARRMSERVAKLGLAVPVIKSWDPDAMGQTEN
ncbi:MAG: SPOR domain-containing protein [Magnetococcales bacterium]|nr:SPOR domain-containing protein [Magnetococcales bacterium]